MKKYLMKCGHVANAETFDGKPVCVICKCYEIANEQPIIIGRKAKCVWCGSERESSFNLPFFEYKPKQEYDSYYCGCGGWD
jgi:hypothetical protein